jgi:hypothetical protein
LKLQTIIDAHHDSRRLNVYKNAKAVVFFSTPHRSVELARMFTMIYSTVFAKKVFIDQLQPQLEVIRNINNYFRFRTADMELVSFYETKAVRWIGVEGGLCISNVIGSSA